MATSRTTYQFRRDPFQAQPLTPGPLGHNDAASPDTPTSMVGDTPGPLGIGDHAKPQPSPSSLTTKNGGGTRKTLPSSMTISQAGLDFILKEEYVKETSDRLHWPGGASGVTLGAGYDMKCRSKAQIMADLTNIGLRANEAERVANATGLAGEAAKMFVRSNRKLVRIDKSMAISLLKLIIKDYERIVKRHVKVPLQQHEYDALVSFAYNPGGRFSTVSKMINGGRVSNAMREISAANTSGGHVLEGLVERRKHEVSLYNYGKYSK